MSCHSLDLLEDLWRGDRQGRSQDPRIETLALLAIAGGLSVASIAGALGFDAPETERLLEQLRLEGLVALATSGYDSPESTTSTYLITN